MYGNNASSIVVLAMLASAATWYLDGILPAITVFAVVVVVPYLIYWLYRSYMRFFERNRKKEDGGS